MFGIFSREREPVPVELVEVTGANLVFLSSHRQLSAGKAARVQLAMPEAGNPVVRVDLVSSRELPGGGRLWSSRVLEDKRSTLHLEVLAAQRNPPDFGLQTRRSPRVPIGLRCRSRELPKYQGLSADVSRSGLRLRTHGSVPVAEYLVVNLDLDVLWLPELSLQVQVVWCRDTHARDGFELGAELTPQHPEVEALWERYCTALVERRAASLYHRMLADEV